MKGSAVALIFAVALTVAHAIGITKNEETTVFAATAYICTWCVALSIEWAAREIARR